MVRSTIDENFGYSHLKEFFPCLNFSEENKTKHQLQYLSFPDNNRIEKGIKRALGPNRYGGSSSSLYL